MVGVPSSKACAPCRKAKKKCSDVASPCTRCSRLNLPCTGLGERRLTFKDESLRFSDKPISVRKACVPCPVTNDFSRFVSTFAHTIDATIDVRMQLPWNFGPFLEDVPRRLGTNEALDASADCLSSAYDQFRISGQAATKPILSKYCHALSQLQHCLAIPDKARSTETLCATMLLMIFETLSGTSETAWINHSGGAAKILKSRGDQGPKNDLEQKLLLTLRGPVILQSIFQSTTPFTPEEWALLTSCETDVEECSVDEQMLRHLAQIPALMRESRQVLNSIDLSLEPLRLASLQYKARQLRMSLKPAHKACVERYHTLHNLLSSSGNTPDHMADIWHAHCARTALLSIATHILVNCIAEGLLGSLHAMPATSAVQALQEESAALSREACEIASQIHRHRPLGTIYMNFVLRVAWVGAGVSNPIDGESLQVQRDRSMAEIMLIDYNSDLHGIEVASAGVRREDLEWLGRYLRLGEVETKAVLSKYG